MAEMKMFKEGLFPAGFFENKKYEEGLNSEQINAIVEYAGALKEYAAHYRALKEEYGVGIHQLRMETLRPCGRLTLEKFSFANDTMKRLEMAGIDGDRFNEALSFLLAKGKGA